MFFFQKGTKHKKEKLFFETDGRKILTVQKKQFYNNYVSKMGRKMITVATFLPSEPDAADRLIARQVDTIMIQHFFISNCLKGVVVESGLCFKLSNKMFVQLSFEGCC